MAAASEEEGSPADIPFQDIVFDTSALRFGGSIDGVNALFLAHYADSVGATLWIPEVVFGECKTLIKEEVSRQRAILSRSIRQLSKLGIEADLEVPPEETMIESATEEFQGKLDSVRVRSLPLPHGLDHHHVLTRLQAGRKPFRATAKKKDIGYRDCLIWETVLSLGADDREGTDDRWVAFITSNTVDFAQKSNDHAVLHPELASEAESKKLKVVLFENVHQFIRQVVKPSLLLSEQAGTLLSAHDWKQQLKNWLEKRLIDEACGYQLADFMNWHGVEVETVGISGVGELVDLEVDEVQELDAGEVVAEVDCRLEVLIDFFVFRSDAYILDDEDFAHLSDWNEHYFYGDEDGVVVKCLLRVGMHVGDDGLEFGTLTISDIVLEEEF